LGEIRQFMYVHNVAKYLSCSKHMVYTLIRQDKLKAIRLGERSIRICKDSFDKFIKENKIIPEDY